MNNWMYLDNKTVSCRNRSKYFLDEPELHITICAPATQDLERVIGILTPSLQEKERSREMARSEETYSLPLH